MAGNFIKAAPTFEFIKPGFVASANGFTLMGLLPIEMPLRFSGVQSVGVWCAMLTWLPPVCTLEITKNGFVSVSLFATHVLKYKLFGAREIACGLGEEGVTDIGIVISLPAPQEEQEIFIVLLPLILSTPSRALPPFTFIGHVDEPVETSAPLTDMVTIYGDPVLNTDLGKAVIQP
jgi:hypothetical protein